MAITSIPNYSTLQDEQFVQVVGPDGITTGFAYDAQQRALYFKESQVVYPSFHGATHIAEDPIPDATCDTKGLMAADDKCKLDALLQTRVGVLGFQGAGFPDDGGWMCFPPDAQVLLADSTTKPIIDLVAGDKLITHTGDVQPVVETFKRDYHGDMLQMWVSGHYRNKFHLTPEHPILSIKNLNGASAIGVVHGYGEFSEPAWVEAKDLKANDYIARRYSSKIIRDTAYVNISEFAERTEVQHEMAYSIQKSGLKHARGMSRNDASPIPERVEVNPEFMRLCGYYLSEGHVDGPCGRPKEIVFSVSLDEAFGDVGADISHCCEVVFGIRPVAGPDPSGGLGGQIVLHSAIAARFISKLLPGTAHTKKIPQWIMELPSEKQKWLLLSLLEGDGGLHIRRKSKSITCRLCNQHLLNQVCALFERLGCTPIVSDGNTKHKNGREFRYYSVVVQAADATWLWHELGGPELPSSEYSPQRLDFSSKIGGYTFRRIKEISSTEYNGTVYNIGVNKDNSYIVNGCVVHNCGDIILAAGTEFISIERIGNVVRFTVDSPIPMNCNSEECQQIFWIQDESDVSAIRPPSCGGKLPGINAYGELKVFAFPESTIVDPNSPATTLNNKGNYPSLVFKRYDDAIVPGSAEYELILKRDSQSLNEIGWVFTPGAAGVAQCVWFMGKDNDGNQIRFEILPEAEPGLFGALLYKGHLISKKMGVVVGYAATILSTNHYTIREWDIDAQKPLGDPFTAKNVWQYANPENPASGQNPKTLLLDSSVDLLPVGTLVDLWFVKVGEVAGEPIRRYYFSKKPTLNPNHMWSWVGQCQFGDVNVSRSEIQPGPGSGDKVGSAQVSNIRNFERLLWGLTGYDDPLVSYDIASTAGTEVADISKQHRAVVDTDLPGLKVMGASDAPDDFSERPVWLWNRRNICNALVRVDLGRPDSSSFTPYDIILRAPIDEHTEKYMKVVGKGTINGLHYVRVSGVHFHDLPPFGSVRVLVPGENSNQIFNYNRKFIFPSSVGAVEGNTEPTGGFVSDFTSNLVDSIVLTGGASDNTPYPGDVGDIIELLHQEYSSPVVRVEFSYDSDTGLVQVQFKVGTLDMSLPYEEDILADDADDYVRGLAAGYAVSAVYSQTGTFTGVGTQPEASPEGFICYEGGAQIGGSSSEYWNTLEIMLRDNQVWIWWNNLLIPPNSILSQSLLTPVTITTPYFTIEQDPNRAFGKVGTRMWPGAKVRRMDVRTQMSIYSEFQHGQLELL